MRMFIAPLNLSTTVVAIFLLSSPAHAQASRTWVSGVGDDANPCSRTAPCKTFAGAISKTAAGGEIDALDPGGFGAVTITKAITIDGGGGQVASIVAAGTNGVNVNAGTTDVVILRNLRLDGLSGQGLNGIQYNSGGALHIEQCNIFGFGQNGILASTNQANATLFVNNTFLQNNLNGVQIAPAGDNLRSVLNQVRANGNSGFGFLSQPGVGASGAGTSITDSSAVVNGTGVGVNFGTVWLGNNVIIRNGTGIAVTAGTVLSYKTNMINGNLSGDGTPLNGIPLN